MSEEQVEETIQTPITVNIIYPPNKPTKFQITAPNVQAINLIFQLKPEYIFTTNYDLVAKTGSILEPDHDLLADVEDNQNEKIVNINVKHLPYNESTALAHVQTLARIYFTLSSHRQYSDCHQSVAGWIYRSYLTAPPGINDLSGFYPENFIKSDLPRPIKIMDFSKSPPTMKERVEGILMKLDITTCENKTFSTYVIKNGWYIEPSKVYPTLHHLLSSISQRYSDSISFIAEKWCNLMAYERQPFTPLNNMTLFQEKKLDSKNQIANRSQLQLFKDVEAENLFTALTLDDYLDDIKNEDSRDIYTYRIEKKYAQEAAEGVEMIKRGQLYPFGDSANYVWKDLFIASMDYMAELQKDRGGIDTANRLLCNEIKSYQQLANSSPSLRVVRTILIDYFTERWAAQSIIPGLLTHQSQIVYGYSLTDRTSYMHNERFDEILEKIAQPLGIAASKIVNSEKQIFGSSEMNGVISTDGNVYAADFHRITPRDANYPDPVKHHGCVIRQEALHSFGVISELEKHSEELIKLGGDKEYLYHQNPNRDPPLSQEQLQSLENARQSIIEKAEKPCFDINALTLDSGVKNPPQNIIDLAKFLYDVVIPKFVAEYVVVSKFVVDGRIIVNEMHSRGINVRYLGRIHTLVTQQKDLSTLNKCFLLSLESEIIARSFKVMMRYNNSSIQEFLTSLNLLLGLTDNKKLFTNLFNSVSDIANDKFGVRPPAPQKCQRILILRSVLRAFGLLLLSRTFDTPIELSDIGSISPVVKFPFSENPQFRSYVDLATTIFSNGDYDSALDLFTVALQISETTVQPFDEGIALCYFYLGLIYERKGDFNAAFNSCIKSLIIQEKYSDQTCPDIIIRYSLLARFAQQLRNPTLAFAFADRAANLASIIMPNHPWVNIEFADAASFAVYVSPELSMKYCEAKIKQCEDSEEGKKQQALFYSIMAKAAIELNNLQAALSFEKFACSLDPQNVNYKESYDLISKTLINL